MSIPNSNQNNNSENLLKKVSEYLGKSPDELKKAVKSGNLPQNLNNISKDDSSNLQKVLSDKNLTSKLLSSPQVQKLLKKLNGDK